MNKAKWDAMSTEQKNAMVKDKIFDGHVFVCKPRSVGRTEFCAKSDPFIHPSFTTSRDSCALVLDKLKKQWFSLWAPFCIYFLIQLHNDTSLIPSYEFGEKGFKDLAARDAGGFMAALLLADPDLICYCAIKAVEE